MVLDACVLYPPSLRDFLLTLAALDAFEVRWSEPILEELRRNVVANHPEVDPDRFSNHTLAEMRRHFPEAMAVVSQAEIDRLDNDPKDRHVAAVGIVATADAIVTINVRDFRSHVLQEAGIAVLTPGELVGQILDAAPEVVGHAVSRIAHRWTNPPRSPAEVVNLIAMHPTMSETMSRAGHLAR